MPNINNTGSPTTTANSTSAGNNTPVSEGSETPDAGEARPVENPPSIQELHDEFAADGWTDEELKTYIGT